MGSMPVECTCKTCGLIFSVIPSQIKHGRGSYCSRPCFYKRPPCPRERAEGIVLALCCDYCGRSFTRTKREHKGNKGKHAYCGRPCAAEAMAATKLPRVSCVCKVCGKRFEISSA